MLSEKPPPATKHRGGDTSVYDLTQPLTSCLLGEIKLFYDPGLFIIAYVERQVNETFVLTEVCQLLGDY
jgi:hypothetical protein